MSDKFVVTLSWYEPEAIRPGKAPIGVDADGSPRVRLLSFSRTLVHDTWAAAQKAQMWHRTNPGRWVPDAAFRGDGSPHDARLPSVSEVAVFDATGLRRGEVS